MALHVLTNLILTRNLRGKQYYHFHFTDKKISAQKSMDLPKILKLVM